jgi:hypothetical protein
MYILDKHIEQLDKDYASKSFDDSNLSPYGMKLGQMSD